MKLLAWKLFYQKIIDYTNEKRIQTANATMILESTNQLEASLTKKQKVIHNDNSNNSQASNTIMIPDSINQLNNSQSIANNLTPSRITAQSSIQFPFTDNYLLNTTITATNLGDLQNPKKKESELRSLLKRVQLNSLIVLKMFGLTCINLRITYINHMVAECM